MKHVGTEALCLQDEASWNDAMCNRGRESTGPRGEWFLSPSWAGCPGAVGHVLRRAGPGLVSLIPGQLPPEDCPPLMVPGLTCWRPARTLAEGASAGNGQEKEIWVALGRPEGDSPGEAVRVRIPGHRTPLMSFEYSRGSLGAGTFLLRTQYDLCPKEVLQL